MFVRKIAVIQEEVSIANSISKTLKDLGHTPTSCTDNFNDALDIIENDNPDLIILDLELKGDKNGVDLAKVIKDKFQIPFIIVTELFDKNSLRTIKKINPSTYLNYPVNSNELEYAIVTHFEKHLYGKIDALSLDLPKEIVVKEKNKVMSISFEEILYIKSDNIYIDLYTKSNGCITLRKSIKEVMKDLDNSFVKVHRSYVVNINKIEAIKSNTVLIDGTEIPISREKKQLIKDLYLSKGK